MYALPSDGPLPPLPPPNNARLDSYENDGSIPVFYRYQYDSDYNAIINPKGGRNNLNDSSEGIKKDSLIAIISDHPHHSSNNSSHHHQPHRAHQQFHPHHGHRSSDLDPDSSTCSPSPPNVNLCGLPMKQDSLSFSYPLISLLLASINMTLNTSLVYLFYIETQHTWFILTFTFLLISFLLVNFCSLKWYIQDYRQFRNEPCVARRSTTSLSWIIKIFAHLLLIGHIFRYFDLLFFTYKSDSLRRKEESKKCKEDFYLSILQQSANLTNSSTINTKTVKDSLESSEYYNYYLLTINEDRDTALLSLIKSFTQSVPIIILQIYIIASITATSLTASNLSLQRTIVMVQLATIFTCLIFTGWSLASYHRALRRSISEKGNMSPIGVILTFLWRLGTLTCRTMSIGLFLSTYSYWILPIAIGHWGIMTIWVMHQGTSFCRHEQSEYLYNMVLGLFYLFDFLNIKDEPTRYKYTAYYTITFIENLILAGLWFIKITHLESPIHHLSALTLYAGSTSAFALGIVFMLIYYRFAHPNGKLLWVNKAAKCC